MKIINGHRGAWRGSNDNLKGRGLHEVWGENGVSGKSWGRDGSLSGIQKETMLTTQVWHNQQGKGKERGLA